MNTSRILLSCAVNLEWDLQQFDIKNVFFFQGDLEDEVYMEIPPRFKDKMTKRKAYRLKKALYSLKQSPRAWLDKFGKTMISFGYHQSNANHTLFMKYRRGNITLLIVYVNDIVVIEDDKEEIAHMKECLAQEFKIKDLDETDMLGCKPVESPIKTNHKLQTGVRESIDIEISEVS
ncbi:hypothetical protein GH714_033744 [Hevea brasiliensis]|uniref:Reverse transcriptase Ty1/copia-type domain-containing protein n=1 Tax=Hevea brasiliensis TaxID=3981 RepID=A0A6A6L506_HEVBR|nr:hypothetical protein GH714_033744 [Hevea brasiliensis]